MSYMGLLAVKPDGDVIPYMDLRNSWLGAAQVWTQLGNKYLGEYDIAAEQKKAKESGTEFDPFGWIRTWELQHSPDIEEQDWVTLMTTFDHMIVPKEHMLYVAEQLEKFAHEFPNTHYKKCAEVLRELHGKGYEGFCIYTTSTAENEWVIENEEDEERPYNIFTDDGHWFLCPEKRPKKEDVSQPSP
jgi:hypothetical protein